MVARSAEFNRQTRDNYGVPSFLEYDIANGQRPIKGLLMTIDDNGRAVATAAGVVGYVGGVAQETRDAATANGQYQVNLATGTWKFDNSSASPITAASVGLPAYAEDNNTARLVNGATGASGAVTNYAFLGIIQRVDSDGVWVHVGGAWLNAATVKRATRALLQTETALIPAALTADFDIANLPASANVIAKDVLVATPWTGGSISAVTVVAGVTAGGSTVLGACSIFTATNGRAASRTEGIHPTGRYAAKLVGRLTATGGNLSTATAGNATIHIDYV